MKTLIILALLILVSCKPKGPTGATSDTPTVNSSTADLSLNFVQSEFNDVNNSWKVITTDVISLGDLGTLNTLSTSVYSTKSAALVKIKNADADYANSSLPLADRNSIPFLKLSEKDGTDNVPVNYTFDYNKIDPNTGIIVATSRGSLISGGDGFAYLPIVNEMFNNKLFISDTSTQQDAYIHKVKILPIYNGIVSTNYKTVTFKMVVTTPMQGMTIQVPNSMANMTLFNRWSNFYAGTDFVTNTSMPLGKIVSTSSPPATPYDIQVVFKVVPLLKTTQTLFVERTVDDISYKTLKVIVPQRGVAYYQKLVTLDSKYHFKSKILINDTVTSPDIAGGNTYTFRNVPASTVWSVGFNYDFTKSTLYPSGQTLLSPLKPQCQLLKNLTFSPIDSYQRLAAHASSGFYTACHPDTNLSYEMTADDAAASVVDLVNTWYDAFSFRKNSTISNNSELYAYDAGHFYGIKDMSLSTSGCMKIYIRRASADTINPNPWEQKNITSGGCGDGWTEYTISHSDSLVNYISTYAPWLDISISLQGLLSAPMESRSDFFFNGDTFDKTNKIY